MALGNQSLTSYSCHTFHAKTSSEFWVGHRGGNWARQRTKPGDVSSPCFNPCAVFAVYGFALSLQPRKRVREERWELHGEAGESSEMGMWRQDRGQEPRELCRGDALGSRADTSPRRRVMCPRGTKKGLNPCAMRGSLSFPHVALQTNL